MHSRSRSARGVRWPTHDAAAAVRTGSTFHAFALLQDAASEDGPILTDFTVEKSILTVEKSSNGQAARAQIHTHVFTTWGREGGNADGTQPPSSSRYLSANHAYSKRKVLVDTLPCTSTVHTPNMLW